MEISWALIINYPNCFNLLNLRNYYISQSINRGLGEGIKESSLESKVMLVVYLHKSWSSRNQSSSNFLLSLFHVLGFDEYIWLSTIYVVYLTYYI